jgi:hypothetical protein
MYSLRRAALFFLFVCAFSLYAQEGTEEPPLETEWARYVPTPYSRGDQTFGINLGLAFPLFYIDKEDGFVETKMNLGGLASLSYNYYLGPRLFFGGELTGAFFSTIAKTNYFIVPLGLKIGYQFVHNRFEFPVSVLLGVAPQQYQSTSYFGFFAKPSVSGFFRITPDWSLGLTTALWWVPQWTSKKRDGYTGNVNIHGFFLDTTIGVRYHF